MQLPPPHPDKSPNNEKERRGSLVLRINRAANDLNPILMVLAIGLLVLNITLYLGLALSREPLAGPVRPANAYSPSGATPSMYEQGMSAGTARN
jgi:hypothetical protein